MRFSYFAAGLALSLASAATTTTTTTTYPNPDGPDPSGVCSIFTTFTTYTVVTDFAVVTSTDITTTFTHFTPVLTSFTTVTVTTHRTATVVVPSSTTTIQLAPTTVGGVKTVTQTCPSSKCTLYYTRTSTRTLPLPTTTTIIDTFTLDYSVVNPTTGLSYFPVTVSGSVLEGSKTVTQSTLYITKTKTVYKPGCTSTIKKTSGVATTTKTRSTKTIAPTATATITLFSLLVDDNFVVGDDGYTFGLNLTGKYWTMVKQNTETWQYYIGPEDGFLYEVTTGRYARYWSGALEGYPFLFGSDKVPAKQLHNMTCTAPCGQQLTCHDASGSKDHYLLQLKTDHGILLTDGSDFTFDAIRVEAVHPVSAFR